MERRRPKPWPPFSKKWPSTGTLAVWQAASQSIEQKGGTIVSVGGEEPGGSIASVYGYDLARGVWQRLPDLPTPRHGLGVAAVGRRVYVVGGGPEPGLTVSDANEVLDLG